MEMLISGPSFHRITECTFNIVERLSILHWTVQETKRETFNAKLKW